MGYAEKARRDYLDKTAERPFATLTDPAVRAVANDRGNEFYRIDDVEKRFLRAATDQVNKTIRDVAEQAGVHYVDVSKAFLRSRTVRFA